MRDLDAPPKEEPRYTINEIFGFFLKVILFVMGFFAYIGWMALLFSNFHWFSAAFLFLVSQFSLGYLQYLWINRPSNN